MGYTGGKEEAENPDYKTVCTGSTDHAEAVRIEFDPSIVTYDELVGACQFCSWDTSVPIFCAEFFYRTHDPTTVNKQGKDTGTRTLLISGPPSLSKSAAEYRSAIFYHTPEQLEIAKRVTEEVQKKHFDPAGTSVPLPQRYPLTRGSQARRS